MDNNTVVGVLAIIFGGLVVFTWVLQKMGIWKTKGKGKRKKLSITQASLGVVFIMFGIYLMKGEISDAIQTVDIMSMFAK